ncbi:MAG: hypothetical protein ABIN25_13880, partial [Ginsengibacter sp.]
MRILIVFLLSANCFSSQSQTIVKYYDAEWAPVEQDKAVYYANFVKEANQYKTTSYWVAGSVLRGKSTYADTSFNTPVGSQVLYSHKGTLEDSAFYAEGKTQYLFHYYPNSQLAMHYYLPDNAKEGIVEGYDEDGKKIKNFVYQKEAEFRGGQKAWQTYITKSVTKDLAVKGDSAYTASVQIQFIVDVDGNVSTVKILTSSGYKKI